MKRFEKKEIYLTSDGLMKNTYELNSMESVRLRIGMIIEKTFDASTGMYICCRHLSYNNAVSLVDTLVTNGDYIRVNA